MPAFVQEQESLYPFAGFVGVLLTGLNSTNMQMLLHQHMIRLLPWKSKIGLGNSTELETRALYSVDPS